jgi:hypothetical protein
MKKKSKKEQTPDLLILSHFPATREEKEIFFQSFFSEFPGIFKGSTQEDISLLENHELDILYLAFKEIQTNLQKLKKGLLTLGIHIDFKDNVVSVGKMFQNN